MSIKANIAKHYRIRIGVMALFMLVACAMFYNDGFNVYPEEGKAYTQYHELKAKYADDQADELQTEWDKIADEHGWEKEGALLKQRTESDIAIQKYIAVGVGVAFLFFAFKLIKTIGNWVAIDEKQISSSSGGSIAFADVTEIDKSRWKKKGIANISGSKGEKILLDNWIYNQEPTDTIMRKLEDNVNHDLIVGGAPEADDADDDDTDNEKTDSDAQEKTSE